MPSRRSRLPSPLRSRPVSAGDPTSRFRVGLTGGIGAGKTEVGKILAGFGAFLIDADVLARESLGPGGASAAEAARRFPESTDASGTLDRAALARRVFADTAERAALNAIVHPNVRRHAAELEATAPLDAVVVHDVPLLFEGDYWRRCDRTIVVVASPSLRLARVSARSGWSDAEIGRRMEAQIDPAIASARADYVIRNEGSRTELAARTTEVWHDLRAAAERPGRI